MEVTDPMYLPEFLGAMKGKQERRMAIKYEEGYVYTPESTKISYISRGEGPCLVFCSGLGVSAASFWPAISRELARYCRTLNWDYRGHGNSEAPAELESLTIPTNAQDLARLLDALEIEKAIVAGHSMGVQVALEFYRQFPDRVLGLIPTLGAYEHPFHTFFRFEKSAQVFSFVSDWALENEAICQRVWPHLFHLSIVHFFGTLTRVIHPTLFPRSELELYLSHLQQISPTVFFHMARGMQAYSADDLLDQIDVPCLIFAGERDFFTPLEISVEMFQRIPNAELQLVKQGSHAALVEQPDLLWLRILHWLRTQMKDRFPLHTFFRPEEKSATNTAMGESFPSSVLEPRSLG